MGALDLFHFANKALTDGGGKPFYRVHLTSVADGSFETWNGFGMVATESLNGYRRPVDTLLVVGDLHAHEAAEHAALIAPLAV